MNQKKDMQPKERNEKRDIHKNNQQIFHKETGIVVVLKIMVAIQC